MFSFFRRALFVCIAIAFVAAGVTTSRAAMQGYVKTNGQKQGTIKGGNPRAGANGGGNTGGNVGGNVHINVHPVITTVKIK
jgi:hypothetical protein